MSFENTMSFGKKTSGRSYDSMNSLDVGVWWYWHLYKITKAWVFSRVLILLILLYFHSD